MEIETIYLRNILVSKYNSPSKKGIRVPQRKFDFPRQRGKM
jgi:hypothetical protein